MLDFISLQLILKVAPGIGNSLEEKIFIGVISSLLFSVIVSLITRKKEKKEFKRQVETYIKSEEEQYYNTLREIAYESEEKYIFNAELTLNELLEACNPKKFFEPYQPSKIEIANCIYSRLLLEKDSILKKNSIQTYKLLHDIWEEAETKLDIYLNSEKIHKILTEIFNLHNFIDENYDNRKLAAANKALRYIENNRGNRRVLEDFARECKIIIVYEGCNEILFQIEYRDEFECGQSVLINGKYQAILYTIEDSCYIFFPFDKSLFRQDDFELADYVQMDYIGDVCLKLPIDYCDVTKHR